MLLVIQDSRSAQRLDPTTSRSESGFSLSAAVRNPPICRTFLFSLSARIHHFPPQLLPGLLPFSTDRCTIGAQLGASPGPPPVSPGLPREQRPYLFRTSDALNRSKMLHFRLVSQSTDTGWAPLAERLGYRSDAVLGYRGACPARSLAAGQPSGCLSQSTPWAEWPHGGCRKCVRHTVEVGIGAGTGRVDKNAIEATGHVQTLRVDLDHAQLVRGGEVESMAVTPIFTAARHGLARPRSRASAWANRPRALSA